MFRFILIFYIFLEFQVELMGSVIDLFCFGFDCFDEGLRIGVGVFVDLI